MSLPLLPARIAFPVQPSTVNVLALAPAVRLTVSIPASVSLPRPASVVPVSVKSTFADSVTMSSPPPPSKASLPARPVNVSSPPRPNRVLPRAFPWSVSANPVPVTFSIPSAVESVNDNPDTTTCVVVSERSTLTPPLARVVKSSVSLSALPISEIVTTADSVPLKT